MNKVCTTLKLIFHAHFFAFYIGLEERLRAQNNSNSNNTNNNNNTNNANKPLTTRTTTGNNKSSRYAFKDEKIDCHTDKNGICYRAGGRD